MKTGLKIFSAITLIGAASFIFYSCKKSETKTSSEQSITKEEAIAKIKNQLKGKPIETTYNLNLPGRGYYSDENGNQIDLNTIKQQRSSYTCPPPDDDYFSTELISITSQYTCGQGYEITVKYYISVLYNLVASNPNNSSQLSKGKLRLKNSSGTVIYNNTNVPISSSNIENLGMDPSDINLTKFRITFTTPYIADVTYGNSSVAEPAAFIYTDCSNVPSISLPYSSSQSVSTTGNYTLPCTRYDKVYYNPAGGGTPASVAGVNAGSGCSIYGYVYPDQQRIQFLNTSVTPNVWTDMPFVLYGSTATGYIANWDVWFIDRTGLLAPVGNYQIRYHNKENNTSYGGLCESSGWVYETWYLN